MLSTLHKARNRRRDGEAGFTLIELLVVVVILGILIAIAIPLYLNYKKSANDKAAQSDLRNAVSTLEVCNSDGSYPTAIDPTAGTLTGCGTSGQLKINLSGGTSVKYVPTPATGTVLTYMIASTNSGGTKFYCYNSANGGAVTSVTAATLTAATC